MTNGNVEFNEVRCKKLVLGDDESGVFHLSVIGNREKPQLMITDSEGNSSGAVYIKFVDGMPTLYLEGEDNGIQLRVNSNGAVDFQIGKNGSEEMSNIVLGIGDENEAFLFITNGKSKGGIISMLAGEEDATVMLTSEDRRENKEGNIPGIAIIQSPDKSFIIVEGKQGIKSHRGKDVD